MPAPAPAPAPAVHQFIPLLSERDATGTHTLLLQEALRRAGWRSEIFTQVTHPDTAHLTIQMEEYPAMASGSDVLLYQFAVASPIADFLLARDEPLVIDYHNVTPPRFFQGWDQGTVSQLVLAREQFSRLAPRAALGLADSSFNRRDLVAAGCPATEVLPVLVDLHRCLDDVDPEAARRLAAEKSDEVAEWLFVGRIVPSKAQHHLVMALWAHHRLWGPTARLRLIGSSGCDGYHDALRTFIAEIGMEGWVELAGGAPDPVLAAYFQNADAYVSLSEHEGFGVPLLEAMAVDLPVVALGAGAVAETVDDAALVLRRGDPVSAATAVRRVTTDPAVRAHLVERGRARVGHFALAALQELAVSAIAAVAGTPKGRPVGAGGAGGRATVGAAGAGAHGASGGDASAIGTPRAAVRGAPSGPAAPTGPAKPGNPAAPAGAVTAGGGSPGTSEDPGDPGDPEDPDFLGRVLDEVEAEARAHREERQLDPAVEKALHQAFQRIVPVAARQHDPMADALREVDAHAAIDPHVPVASARAGGAALKRAMRAASQWYVGFVAHQVTELAGAVSRTLHLLADQVDQLRADLADLQPATDLVVGVPSVHRADAWWVGALLDAIAPEPGRVLHAACGNGWLVSRLREHGLDAYGVDPRPAPIAAGELEGLDLRCEPVPDHLRSVAPGGLRAVVLTGVVEALVDRDRQRLVALASERLADGGVLALHSVTPAGWTSADTPPEADLAPGRPLRPATWRYLLEAAGLTVTVHERELPSEAGGVGGGATADVPADYLVLAWPAAPPR